MTGFLNHQPLEPDRVVATLSAPHEGGVVTFVGMVRDHQNGRRVTHLEYSAYLPMAEAECGRIVREAEGKWPVRVVLQHRIGSLAVGEPAVVVGVASAHRAPAFEACRYVIEEVKRRVPIWKKEFYTDGTVSWVNPAELRAPVAEGIG